MLAGHGTVADAGAMIEAPAGSFLASLPEPERSGLLAAGRSRRWPPGDALVRHGDRVDSAIVIASGWVKIHATSADGAEVVLGCAGPGELLGEISAVRDARRSATAVALEPVGGVVIGVASLRRFLTA